MVKSCGSARLADYAATSSSCNELSTYTPFRNVAPARTSAMSFGPWIARHRSCADSMSLKAIASPAAREPGPLVIFVRSRTVAKVDSMGFEVFRWIQCSAGKS